VRFPAAVCALLIGLAGPSASAGRGPATDLQQLWRTVGGFTPSQVSAVERGEPVARVLRTDRREIAIMGAVRIRGARERLIDRYRDISSLRKSELVLQVGTFGRPPRPEDLAALTFEDYDLDAPRSCSVGHCAVRLSADEMSRMRAAVRWDAPDARQQSAAAWREMLGNVARRYVQDGDPSLPVFANKAEPLGVRDELDALYGQFGFLVEMGPEFLRYVREFPRARLPGAEDTLYWSKNDLGIRPVVGITHQVSYAPPEGPAFIAQKRIYAAHYVDGGLGVTMVTDDEAGGFYMTIVDRVRTRSLTGFTRAIVRSIVQDKSRDGVERLLRSSKRSVEAVSSR
jgi:hypothetical protein